MSLIEIGLVVIEIQGVENGELVVPVNNTLVRHTAFLAADTTMCLDSMHYAKNYSRIILLQRPRADTKNWRCLFCAASNDLCGVMAPFAH